MADDQESPSAVAPTGQVVLSDQLVADERAGPGRIALFLLGSLLVALFIASLALALTSGSKTKTFTPPASTVTTTSTTQGPHSTSVVTSNASKGTTAKTTSTSTPSEGVLLALLGSGVILAVAGALYTRISAITLPGGAGITLTPEEAQRVVARVAEKAGEETTPPDIAQATSTALQLAQATKASGVHALDETALDLAATAAVQVATRASEDEGTRLRRINVVVQPGSPAHQATRPPTPRPRTRSGETKLAPGFAPQPEWNLSFFGGRRLSDLAFVNCYVGQGGWVDADMESIDRALRDAMTDEKLQSVIAQYFDGAISSQMLPRIRHQQPIPPTIYKDQVEHLDPMERRPDAALREVAK
jgi:hypothetical protein